MYSGKKELGRTDFLISGGIRAKATIKASEYSVTSPMIRDTGPSVNCFEQLGSRNKL